MKAIKLIWQLLTHLPPLIVGVPFKLFTLVHKLHYYIFVFHTIVLGWFGVLTFKLSYFLTPQCCRDELEKRLQSFTAKSSG